MEEKVYVSLQFWFCRKNQYSENIDILIENKYKKIFLEPIKNIINYEYNELDNLMKSEKIMDNSNK